MITKKTIPFFISFIVTVLITQSAYGLAFSYTHGVMNWNLFILTLDTGMTLSWIEKQSSSDVLTFVNNGFGGDREVIYEWGDATASNPITNLSGTAVGVASTSSDILSADSMVFSSSAGQYQYRAQAFRGGSFQISGNGYLTISIPYDLSLDLSLNNSSFDDYTSGFVSAVIDIYNNSISQIERFSNEKTIKKIT